MRVVKDSDLHERVGQQSIQYIIEVVYRTYICTYKIARLKSIIFRTSGALKLVGARIHMYTSKKVTR